jgi:hypothetical protein
MPIIDHFSEKIRRISHFHSFHNAWATEIAADLNEVLPKGFIAEPNVQIGSFGEIDVRADELLTEEEKTLLMQYHIPAAVAKIRVSFPDETEIFIINIEQARRTVGVVEIVSPSNKNRPENREIFVSKCLSFISQGISLIIVDIVTVRPFNFHNELLSRLRTTEGWMQVLAPSFRVGDEMPLYCSSYRYTFEFKEPSVELWAYALEVGDVLPELPLFISPEIAVPVKLEKTYMETRKRFRVFVE